MTSKYEQDVVFSMYVCIDAYVKQFLSFLQQKIKLLTTAAASVKSTALKKKKIKEGNTNILELVSQLV